MFGSFRLAMTWVHTWFGLLLGYVLLVAFFFGSLAVFAGEIDQWSFPASRGKTDESRSWDEHLRPAWEALGRAPQPPSGARLEHLGAHRVGGVVQLEAHYEVPLTGGEHEDWGKGFLMDARSGAVVEAHGSRLGSDVFFPLHFNLTHHWDWDVGRWLVAASAFVMMIALVSGIVIHRKLLAELFTFRSAKLGQRRLLDLHNLTGVTALPFHFFFAFTGILIFSAEYFPGQDLLIGKVENPEYQAPPREKEPIKSTTPAQLVSVDAIVQKAREHWRTQGHAPRVAAVELNELDHAEPSVVVVLERGARLGGPGPYLTFSATTGKLLRGTDPRPPIWATKDYVEGVHMVHFGHDTLRWLFFFGGLVGCVCIATGFIFFVGKRRRRHAAQRQWGAAIADAFGVASVTGTLLATAALLLANRTLPAGAEDWEFRIFCYAWLLTLVHALLRTSAVREGKLAPAWREQCYALALLAPAAAIANWLTTGDHLFATLRDRSWPVACVDLTLLVTAALALFAALRLKQREAAFND